MPQVLVKASMDRFYYALNHNRRRRPLIATGCATAEEVVLRCGQEFHRKHPQTLAVTMSTSRKDWQRKVADYYDKVCHVRLAKELNDSVGGFVVVDGELIGLHNIREGCGDWMLCDAISLGANRLDTYDIPHLVDLYKRHGFREVLREPNKIIKGGAAVIFMRKE